MTLLSRKADYALLILSFLYQKREGGTARAIAEKFGISRAFVANILKELCHKGFVASHRGVKGGYALARPAHTISLAELLESLEDGFRLTMCNPAVHAEGGTCTLTEVCTVKGAITEVHRRLIEVLRGVSLAELFDPNAQKPVPLTALPLITEMVCCSGSTKAVDPATI
ncbi:MAG TPA: Rrf2 family transcriptional regulator [Gemmataceae bacterium]|nr:Rrf2 family transcriptional regulator [Gemmataceae bacterium]